MTFLTRHFLPSRWHNQFLDYRLGINDKQRARFKDLKSALEADLLSGNTDTVSKVLKLEKRVCDASYGVAAFKEFKLIVSNMCRDSRLSSLAADIELLGHQHFANHNEIFSIPNLALDRFLASGNVRLQDSVLKTFPAGELLDARRYLAEHPKFYSVAKANFWLPFFELLDLTALTVDKRPFFMQEGKLAVRVQGHSKEYKVRNWTAIEQELKEDLRGKALPYRLIQRGLAVGKNHGFENLEPFMEVDSGGRCVIQMVTSVLRKAPFANPVGVSLGNTGHGFTQVIIPIKGEPLSDTFSFGFFVKDRKSLDQGPLTTVPGLYKSPDDHVTRIAEPDSRKGYIAIVKEFELSDDQSHNTCLLAYADTGDLDAIHASLKARDSEGFNSIVLRLAQKKKVMSSPIDELMKEDKAKALLDAIDNHIRIERDFQATEANCTVEQRWQEDFIIKLLNAEYHHGEPVRVYKHQMALGDVKISVMDRVWNACLKLLIMLGAIIPNSGIGRRHPDSSGEAMMHREDALKAPFVRMNTTFSNAASPANIPTPSVVERIKNAFFKFINYLRGAELPI